MDQKVSIVDLLEAKKKTNVADSSQQTPDEYIRIRVMGVDSNEEIHYRVKENTFLKRMMKSYQEKMNLEDCQLRFMYEGYTITDMDTPKMLDMKSDDIVDVYQIRTGGSM